MEIEESKRKRRVLSKDMQPAQGTDVGSMPIAPPDERQIAVPEGYLKYRLERLVNEHKEIINEYDFLLTALNLKNPNKAG